MTTCAWCPAVLDEGQGTADVVSRSVCAECYARVLPPADDEMNNNDDSKET